MNVYYTPVCKGCPDVDKQSINCDTCVKKKLNKDNTDICTITIKVDKIVLFVRAFTPSCYRAFMKQLNPVIEYGTHPPI